MESNLRSSLGSMKFGQTFINILLSHSHGSRGVFGCFSTAELMSLQHQKDN